MEILNALLMTPAAYKLASSDFCLTFSRISTNNLNITKPTAKAMTICPAGLVIEKVALIKLQIKAQAVTRIVTASVYRANFNSSDFPLLAIKNLIQY